MFVTIKAYLTLLDIQSLPVSLKLFRLMQVHLLDTSNSGLKDTLSSLFELYAPSGVKTEPILFEQQLGSCFCTFVSELAARYISDSFGDPLFSKCLVRVLCGLFNCNSYCYCVWNIQ